MKRVTLVVLLLVLAAGLASAVPATARAQEAEPQVSVSASFDPPAATIGDRVVLRVRVQHSPDLVVSVERPNIRGGEVIGDAQPLTEPQPDGSVVTSYEFRYQLFALGEVEPGEIRVRWLQEDGTSGVVGRPGPVLTMVSVRAPGDEALRPLKPQLTVAGAPPAWLVPAGIAAAVVLGVAALAAVVVWWRRRRVAPPLEVAPVTAEERARERLDTLRGHRLDSEEAFQSYYGTIALAVRGYLAERFGFNATALTTTELERWMTSHGVDRWQARLVGGLLDRCDRAVYARQYPEPASADHDLTVAYEIVELSRPSAGEEERAAS